MNLEEARKILNLSIEELSDDELVEHIETATFLKDIFFDNLINRKLKDSYAKSET